MHVYVCIYMYVCMYVCIYVHVCIRVLPRQSIWAWFGLSLCPHQIILFEMTYHRKANVEAIGDHSPDRAWGEHCVCMYVRTGMCICVYTMYYVHRICQTFGMQ